MSYSRAIHFRGIHFNDDQRCIAGRLLAFDLFRGGGGGRRGGGGGTLRHFFLSDRGSTELLGYGSLFLGTKLN